MSDDDIKPATYQLVISVDARRSGEYDDGDKPELRKQLYHVVEPAFLKAGAAPASVHLEDRGDGILATVAAAVPPSGLLGVGLVEMHEQLRASNRRLARPLGLRIGMHVGPVREDSRGVSGRAVDLACRLADCQEARRLLDAARADLICVVSDSLYQDVVSPGGWGINPETYRSGPARLKEGEVTAWFHLPGLGRAQSSATDLGRVPDSVAREVLDEMPEPGSGHVTIGRDQHNHNQSVYRGPVRFGDTHREAGHE